MKKSTLTAFVLSSILSTSVMANAQAVIPFGTLNIPPITQDDIPLPSLNNHNGYNVKCTMMDTTNINAGTIVGFGTKYVIIVPPLNGDYIYNGQSLGKIVFGYRQRPLAATTHNVLIAQKLQHRNSSLNFINTSTTDYVRVSCEAIIN